MQGYILNVAKVKNEDCIVSILTRDKILRTYRFYGARHSAITLGYKIDFETESSITFMPRLKSTMHLGFAYLLDRNRLIKWQELSRLLYQHLRDLEDVDGFYFELLDEASHKFNKQNPKRVALEIYAQILDYEGRKHNTDFCYFCGMKTREKICLTRGFLPSHYECTHGAWFDKMDIAEFFKLNSTINLDDIKVDKLYNILLEGF